MSHTGAKAMLQPMAAACSLAMRPRSWAYWTLPVAPILMPEPMFTPSEQAPSPPASVLQAMNTGTLAYFCRMRFCSSTFAPGMPLYRQPPRWYFSMSSFR